MRWRARSAFSCVARSGGQINRSSSFQEFTLAENAPFSRFFWFSTNSDERLLLLMEFSCSRIKSCVSLLNSVLGLSSSRIAKEGSNDVSR